jgi:hypothetical protein
MNLHRDLGAVPSHVDHRCRPHHARGLLANRAS